MTSSDQPFRPILLWLTAAALAALAVGGFASRALANDETAPSDMGPAVGVGGGVVGDPVAVEAPTDDALLGDRGLPDAVAPLRLELPGLEFAGCGGMNLGVVNEAWDQEVVELTNAERLRYGSLPPLKRVERLGDGARYHSADMAGDNYFQHDSYDRGTSGLTFACSWVSRVQGYYGSYQALAENIAAGYTSPSAVLAGWMASSGHRANILSTSVREIGAGFYCCSGGYTRYWTQDFGTKPGVYPLVIERESDTTTRTEVQVYIYGSFSEMRLRNDQGTWAAWRPFASSFSWGIPASEGVHTVSAEMRSGTTTYQSSDAIYYSPSGAPAPTESSAPPPTSTRVSVPPTATRLSSPTPRIPSPTPTRTRTSFPTSTMRPSQTPLPLPSPTAGGVELAVAPSDDALVFSGWPYSNFGRSTSLAIQDSAGSKVRAYLKFLVTGLNAPPRRAVLRMTVYDGGSSGGDAYLVGNLYLGSSVPWSETGLTWANAPILLGQPLASVGAVRVGDVVEYPVTPAIRGNGMYSFALDTSSADMVAFRSREFTSSPPRLVIKP